MSRSEPAVTTARRLRSAALAALVLVSAIALSRPAALTETDGAVPEGVGVFDDDLPAVANLDPSLLRALRQAARAAAREGVEMVVNSGWRSREYQTQLLRDAVTKYGSEKAAARWVATPDRSAHVSGDAVDIGPARATAWLIKHGAEYRLCRVYRNEPWHYELRGEAIHGGCPSMYADPSRPSVQSRVPPAPGMRSVAKPGRARIAPVSEGVATPAGGPQPVSITVRPAPQAAIHSSRIQQ
jgi:D-alanyl-D-alanine carboxypeptidase